MFRRCDECAENVTGVNEARLVRADLSATNGVVHLIDRVLTSGVAGVADPVRVDASPPAIPQ